ncbi:MAG: aldo/keto reductase [bacterium]
MAKGHRSLGRSGLQVSPIGLGCMGLSEFYGPRKEANDAKKLIDTAIDLGVTHFDTAEMYGMGHNESLVGPALAGHDDVVLATKFGPLRDPETGAFTGVDGSEQNARRAIEGSLRRLGRESVDLYYLHRVDRSRPIEETVEAMAKLVQEGKVRAIGLSEASAATLRRAHAVHPIAALQTEYSIFTRDIEDEILPACRELGVTLVAYSPLGRGFLTGRFDKMNRPSGKGDFRQGQSQPRFEAENFERNLELVETVKDVAARHGVTPAQVALAWVLDRGNDIVTIPGTTRIANLEANLGALDVELTDGDREALDSLSEKVRGQRYGEHGMAGVNV